MVPVYTYGKIDLKFESNSYKICKGYKERTRFFSIFYIYINFFVGRSNVKRAEPIGLTFIGTTHMIESYEELTMDDRKFSQKIMSEFSIFEKSAKYNFQLVY